MSKISSDKLYHFTHKLEYLESILMNGFYPRCSMENYHFIFDQLNVEDAFIGHCMVCFCDLPVELQKEHKNSYGRYGIAMTKAWGMKKGISPVMYVHENSDAINSLKHMAVNIRGFIMPQNRDKKIMKHKVCQRWIEFAEEIFGSFNQFIGYLKLYTENDKRYYDEREWRYLYPWVTPDKIKEGYTNVLIGKNNEDNIKSLNKEMEKHPLLFDLDDIFQIIVPSNEEKNKLELYIKTNKEKFSKRYLEIDKLIDKINVHE